jgi:transcriptional regulator GlxA family with amidase domain
MIMVRLLHNAGDPELQLEVENTGINLMQANDVCSKATYHFIGHTRANGTLYRLVLPLYHQEAASNLKIQENRPVSIPYFYKELQKRFRSHFTQTERLMANLVQSQPQEAAFMQKINALITVNLGNENFDTNALCKAMSMSRTQLFRRLKLLIRLAPAHHIKNMRLQKAKELLETTDLTVSEIAFKTGNQTVSHFTKIFKKQYGIPPSVFRLNGKSATNE